MEKRVPALPRASTHGDEGEAAAGRCGALVCARLSPGPEAVHTALPGRGAPPGAPRPTPGLPGAAASVCGATPAVTRRHLPACCL